MVATTSHESESGNEQPDGKVGCLVPGFRLRRQKEPDLTGKPTDHDGTREYRRAVHSPVDRAVAVLPVMLIGHHLMRMRAMLVAPWAASDWVACTSWR
jgi:hypothetical protein